MSKYLLKYETKADFVENNSENYVTEITPGVAYVNDESKEVYYNGEDDPQE